MKFNVGSCADPESVGAMLSVFRLPGSMLSSVISAAVKEVGSVVTWDRSRTPWSRSGSAAFQKTLMGVLAPSSRGVTKVHEDSDGCTVWCMVSQPSDSVASSPISVHCLVLHGCFFNALCFSLFRCLVLVQAQAQAASS